MDKGAHAMELGEGRGKRKKSSTPVIFKGRGEKKRVGKLNDAMKENDEEGRGGRGTLPPNGQQVGGGEGGYSPSPMKKRDSGRRGNLLILSPDEKEESALSSLVGGVMVSGGGGERGG